MYGVRVHVRSQAVFWDNYQKTTKIPMKRETKLAVLLGIVMLATLRHSAAVYLSISPLQMSSAVLNWAYAIAVVSAIDFTVIIFTLEGSKRLPKIFAIGLALLTFAYFLNIEFVTKIIGIGVFTALLPLAGYEFAELFSEGKKAKEKTQYETEAIRQLRDKVWQLEKEAEYFVGAQAMADAIRHAIDADCKQWTEANDHLWTQWIDRVKPLEDKADEVWDDYQKRKTERERKAAQRAATGKEAQQ